jgi:hypothetical protein
MEICETRLIALYMAQGKLNIEVEIFVSVKYKSELRIGVDTMIMSVKCHASHAAWAIRVTFLASTEISSTLLHPDP